MGVKKAVIPAAGLGIRFLPVTKAQPKEMIPVNNKPTIQYVVEEAVDSGIDDILIITGRGKRAIEDHFDRAPELEFIGKTENLRQLDELLNSVSIHFIRQKEQRGLGDAVYCARYHIGDEPFALLLGDTITIPETQKEPYTKQLIDQYKKYETTIIAVERVKKEKISSYGIIKPRKLDDSTYLIEDLIEKPQPEEAPSDLGIIGRYILTPEIFEKIKQTKPGVGKEIQLTDSLGLLLKEQEMYAHICCGKIYDIGNRLDWLIANVGIVLEHNDDTAKEFRKYLKGLSL